MNDIEAAVKEYVIDEYIEEEDEVEVENDTPLISSGIVDSFSMVSLLAFLEKNYAIKIPPGEATPEAFDTIDSIAALVRRHLSA